VPKCRSACRATFIQKLHHPRLQRRHGPKGGAVRFFNLHGLRINRGELSGAFGDIGTDLPLITGMILATGMNPSSVLVVFGLAQIASAIIYGIPMPVQPLKAVAALAIAGEVGASQVYGAGLGIGLTMFLLVATGWLERLRRVIPKAVIRGIQLGLGFKLAHLALTRYIPADGWSFFF